MEPDSVGQETFRGTSGLAGSRCAWRCSTTCTTRLNCCFRWVATCGLRTVELNPRSSPTLNTGQVSADSAGASGKLLQFEKDIRAPSCNRAFMQLQTGRIFQPEVSELDGYWVRVAVAQDVRFPDLFQCEVSLFPREADSQWSDLDVSKPVDEPHVLREFRTPAAAYEHGLALGHILTSVY